MYSNEMYHAAYNILSARAEQLDEDELYHHGILGQKWGVRRYQNEDGSLTPAGRTRYGIEKLEKEAIDRRYKESRKNGGSYVFKRYRHSTGENYDNAMNNFDKHVLNDKTYKDLSRKAFDAEKKRLMSEKPYADDEEAYDNYIRTKEYRDLYNASIKASEAKEKYVEKMAKDYVNTIKDAKIKDMNIKDKDIEFVRSLLSDDNNTPDVWDVHDNNLEYNPDNFYEEWVEKEKYR